MTHKTMAGRKVEYEGRLSAEEVADQLVLLAEGIRSHELLVETGNDSLSMLVGDGVQVGLEFKAEERKNKIALELRWADRRTEMDVSPRLHIEPLAGSSHDQMDEDDETDRDTPPTLDAELTEAHDAELAAGSDAKNVDVPARGGDKPRRSPARQATSKERGSKRSARSPRARSRASSGKSATSKATRARARGKARARSKTKA